MTSPRPAIGPTDSRNEHAVIAAMLNDPALLRLGAALVKRPWFVDGRHGDVFSALLDIQAAGSSADLVELVHRLPTHDAGWLAGLLDGADYAGFEKRCKAIANAHKQRMALGKLAMADAASPEPQRAEALAQAAVAIAAVNSSDGDRVVAWPVVELRAGKMVPSKVHVENTQALFDAYGVRARYNLMTHKLELTIPGFEVAAERSENATLARVVEIAERNGLAEKQTLSHMQIIADSYHPVWDWVQSRPWDGVDRLTALMGTIQIAETADFALHGLLMQKWLLSCVRAVAPWSKDGPVFRPQGVLTLQGAQGIGKSRWIEALAPAHSGWVLTGAALDPHDKDSVEQLTSVWICELGELDGTISRNHTAAIKMFVDRPADTYRRAYARASETVARRTVMAASVNPKAFLVDDTGSRRWWALPVQHIVVDHGIDMQQLWAQVARRLHAGEPWWLNSAETLALNVANLRHTVADPIVEDLWDTWKPGEEWQRETMADIWSAMPGRSHRPRTRVESLALTQALEPLRCSTLTHGCAAFRVQRRKPQDVDLQTEARH